MSGDAADFSCDQVWASLCNVMDGPCSGVWPRPIPRQIIQHLRLTALETMCDRFYLFYIAINIT